VSDHLPRTIISGPGVRGDGKNFAISPRPYVRITPPADSPQSAPFDPLSFQVILGQDNSGNPQWGVWYGILRDVDSSEIGVSNFLASLDPTDANWESVSAGNIIWLELAIDSTTGLISSASIQCTSAGNFGGGEFEYISDMASNPTYSQTYCRFVLGIATTNGAGTLIATNRAGDKQVYNSGATALDSTAANPQFVPVLMVSQ
jgi:hypothetical protein